MGARRDALLAGCFLLLLLGQQVCPWRLAGDICLLPKEGGFCKASHVRWHYDRYSQTCQTFIYGGCPGNNNNFLTKEECEQACQNINRVPKECRLEVNEGTCEGFYTRYFFNLNRMRCEAFSYGGCGGNENQFSTKISCLEYCLPQENHREMCLLPKEGGFCKARRVRWYYDRYSQTCQTFIYGGCGGNDNHFLTKEECELTCQNINSIRKWRAHSGKREDQPYAYEP